jgi:hypothetical protein
VGIRKRGHIIAGEAYVDAGVYARGKCAESQLLAGFTVDVNDVFDAQ